MQSDFCSIAAFPKKLYCFAVIFQRLEHWNCLCLIMHHWVKSASCCLQYLFGHPQFVDVQQVLAGLLQEAKMLLDLGLIPAQNCATRAIGYRISMEYLQVLSWTHVFLSIFFLWKYCGVCESNHQLLPPLATALMVEVSTLHNTLQI